MMSPATPRLTSASRQEVGIGNARVIRTRVLLVDVPGRAIAQKAVRTLTTERTTSVILTTSASLPPSKVTNGEER
jgi:hypothetical protein